MPSDSQQTIAAASIGAAARQILDRDNAASLLGVTSRGAFLLFTDDWVVFLSAEPFRGPLTINLSGAGWLGWLQPGAQAQVREGEMFFPSCGLTIQTAQAAVWAPSMPAAPALPPLDRWRRLRLIARRTLALQQNGRQSALLKEALGEAGSGGQIPHVRQALSTGDPVSIAAALQPLLGLGAGLTPSGDDLAAGLLLAYARWEAALTPPWKPAGLADAVVALARQRTTVLSASLIACAAQGQADERLVLALDGVLTGQPGVEDCADALAAWGASSGGDCLAGIALALSPSVV